MEMGQKVMWIGLHKLRYSAGGGEGGRGVELRNAPPCLVTAYLEVTLLLLCQRPKTSKHLEIKNSEFQIRRI